MIDDDLPMLTPISDDPLPAEKPVVTWKPDKPATEIVAAKPARVPLSSRFAGCAVPVSILFAAVLIATAILMSGGSGAAPQPHDDHRQVIDDGGQVVPQPIDSVMGDLSECLLIVVRDPKLVNEQPEYAAALQDDAFWESAAARVRDVEFFADNDPVAKKFIGATGISSPFVALINKNRHPVWTLPLPRNGTQAIKDKLDGR